MGSRFCRPLTRVQEDEAISAKRASQHLLLVVAQRGELERHTATPAASRASRRRPVLLLLPMRWHRVQRPVEPAAQVKSTSCRDTPYAHTPVTAPSKAGQQQHLQRRQLLVGSGLCAWHQESYGCHHCCPQHALNTELGRASCKTRAPR